MEEQPETLTDGQFHPDNPVFSKPHLHCFECGGQHEPSGSRSECISFWKGRAVSATDLVEWARALLCSATPNPKLLDEAHQVQWAEGFGRWFANSHTITALSHDWGVAKMIYDWVKDHKYCHLIHRHNGHFRIINEANGDEFEAETLPALSDLLLNHK